VLVRKATVLAISSGSAKRSNGLILANCSICLFDFPTKNKSVAVGLGATAFTVIDLPRNFFAKIAVHAEYSGVIRLLTVLLMFILPI